MIVHHHHHHHHRRRRHHHHHRRRRHHHHHHHHLHHLYQSSIIMLSLDFSSFSPFHSIRQLSAHIKCRKPDAMDENSCLTAEEFCGFMSIVSAAFSSCL